MHGQHGHPGRLRGRADGLAVRERDPPTINLDDLDPRVPASTRHNEARTGGAAGALQPRLRRHNAVLAFAAMRNRGSAATGEGRTRLIDVAAPASGARR
jgi:hypothetical protein